MNKVESIVVSSTGRDETFRLFALLTATVFVGLIGIGLALKSFNLESGLITYVAIALALTAVLFGILYNGLLKHILGRNKLLTDNASQLRVAHDWLEQRVEARTLEMQETNQALERTVVRLRNRQREMSVLGEMGNLFQACRNVEEACEVARDQLSRLFPDLSGTLFLMSPCCKELDRVAQWGVVEGLKDGFRPDDCWALRRGKPHEFGGDQQAVACHHVDGAKAPWHLCLPMTAQGEAIGLLYLQSQQRPADGTADEEQAEDDRTQFYAAVADSVALAFANLRLREKLQHQALRDPLTGLFNRRYLIETLERELHRAERSEQPLSVIMLDIDHFKSFNDTYGHGAGDAMLEAVGKLLRSRTRIGDIACRYGGEEFAIVLPGAPAEITLRRVDALRKEIQSLSIQYRGNPLAQITISAGVSVYPMHGPDEESLIHAADQALYSAKQKGRNQSVLAPEPKQELVQETKAVELVRKDGYVILDNWRRDESTKEGGA